MGPKPCVYKQVSICSNEQFIERDILSFYEREAFPSIEVHWGGGGCQDVIPHRISG